MKGIVSGSLGLVVAGVLVGCAGQTEQLSMQGPRGATAAVGHLPQWDDLWRSLRPPGQRAGADRRRLQQQYAGLPAAPVKCPQICSTDLDV
jgi:hypothetical protein